MGCDLMVGIDSDFDIDVIVYGVNSFGLLGQVKSVSDNGGFVDIFLFEYVDCLVNVCLIGI